MNDLLNANVLNENFTTRVGWNSVCVCVERTIRVFHETRMAEHGDETRKSKRAGRLKSADSILQSKRERRYPRCIVAHCG